MWIIIYKKVWIIIHNIHTFVITKVIKRVEEAITQSGNKVLKPDVLVFINTTKHRIELARIQGLSEAGIRKQIRNNSTRLTEYASLEYICQVYGCKDAGELVEPQTDKV